MKRPDQKSITVGVLSWEQIYAGEGDGYPPEGDGWKTIARIAAETGKHVTTARLWANARVKKGLLEMKPFRASKFCLAAHYRPKQ